MRVAWVHNVHIRAALAVELGRYSCWDRSLTAFTVEYSASVGCPCLSSQRERQYAGAHPARHDRG